MSSKFPIKDIPNSSNIYRRVLRENQIIDDKPGPKVFQNTPNMNSFSAEWDEYSTPLDTQNNHKSKRYKTEDFAVVSLNVGCVRNIKDQDVIHTPTNNQAHCRVEGEKDLEIIYEFIDISSWEII